MHGKQDRLFFGRAVGVLVPRPQGHDESVTFLPMKRLAVDRGRAGAAKRVINAGAGVPVRLGSLAGAKQLNPAAQRRQGRATGGWVYIFQCDAVMGVSVAVGQALERWIGIVPAVMKQWHVLLTGVADGPSHPIVSLRVGPFVHR